MGQDPESSENSIKEQLDRKYIDLYTIAATCGLNGKDVCNDIADSMEEATNVTKPLDSLEISESLWGHWWYKFLEK